MPESSASRSPHGPAQRRTTRPMPDEDRSAAPCSRLHRPPMNNRSTVLASIQSLRSDRRACPRTAIAVERHQTLAPSTLAPGRCASFARDLQHQAGWLARQAAMRGYSDLDELLSRAPQLYSFMYASPNTDADRIRCSTPFERESFPNLSTSGWSCQSFIRCWRHVVTIESILPLT